MTPTKLNLMAAIQDFYFVTYPGPWAGHIPFAYWVVNTHKPKVIVELGTFRGNSYFNFCHAVKNFGLDTKTYAVDTWKGDEHGGFYGGHIYHEVKEYNEKNFSSFSTLIRSTFDQSIDKFSDGSIDLLHIDGYHTYEAVKNDFEKWLPKLSNRGVLLLHDTNVFTNNFGVWKFFEELKKNYPFFCFSHSNGLGVVMVGSDITEELLNLNEALPDNRLWREALVAFSRLGRLCEHASENQGKIENLITTEEESSLSLLEQIKQLESEAVRLHAVSDEHHQEIEKLEGSITSLAGEKKQLLEMLKEAATIVEVSSNYREKVKRLEQKIFGKDGEVHHLNSEVHHLNIKINEISDLVNQKDIALTAIKESSSWKITYPLRRISIMARKGITFSRLLAQGRVSDIKSIILAPYKKVEVGHQVVTIPSLSSEMQREGASVTIVATHHTLFVAYILASSLISIGFDVAVVTEMPQDYTSRFYFVVCAQMFDRLPPAEKRVCVQLEQSSMSRWFTDKYISVLKQSLAVIEYSSSGLSFLDGLGISYPKVFYAKIGGLSDYVNFIKNYGIQVPATEKEYDVIFYGDTNNIRRQRILDLVQRKYKVKIINNLFGEKLYTEISKAKVCLNIHYYDGASLESTRIFEALSIGVPVVTETSDDACDYDFSLYGDSIAFAEVGDSEQIVSLIGKIIDQGVTVPNAANRQSGAIFNFYINRLMMALGAIDFRRVYSQSGRLKMNSHVIALSMPETFERRSMLMSKVSDDTTIFPGLRATPGWVGAACSFKYLAKKLLESGVEHALIFEDDAEFISGMSSQEILAFALRVKQNVCDWDVFSAFISDLHCDAKIRAVFTAESHECIMLNRMVGMVCNVYSRKALEIIAQWDETNRNIETNTIDRYLEAFDDLRVVTTLPFLVGQSEGVSSSMWGVKNFQMRDMITSSSNLLFEKVWAFKAAKMLKDNNVEDNVFRVFRK